MRTFDVFVSATLYLGDDDADGETVSCDKTIVQRAESAFEAGRALRKKLGQSFTQTDENPGARTLIFDNVSTTLNCELLCNWGTSTPEDVEQFYLGAK